MQLSFNAPNGWNVHRGDYGVGDFALPTLWTSDTAFAKADVDSRFDPTHQSAFGIPTETIAALPENAIVLVAMGPRAYTGQSDFPLFKPPLRLVNGYQRALPYGVSSDTAEFHIDRWVGDQLLNVTIWLGASESAQLEQIADDALARLTIA